MFQLFILILIFYFWNILSHSSLSIRYIMCVLFDALDFFHESLGLIDRGYILGI